LRWLARGFLSLWGFAAAYVIGSFMKTPVERRSLGERLIDAGDLDSLGVGDARVVRNGREPIFVVRKGENTLIALSGICTHLHCVLTWNGARQRLDCPCHRGAFDINGNVAAGPASRALQLYDVETRLGRIYVRI
jgi:Rieske Fe-S protein